MEKGNNKPEIVHDIQSGYLALPFNQEQFKEFVKGLLGTPQTITKRIKGTFELQLKDLQNFHDLIHQRIAQQNNGSLIQLKTQIYYTDDSSVTLSSYQELVTYNEIKPVISEAVRMTWSYLIQFADKNVPEKQEIEIMIIAVPQPNIIEDSDIPVIYLNNGQFKITIKHTARTWGSDMEGLITNQISSILLHENRFKNFIRQRSTTIGLLTGIIFLLSSITTIYFSTRRFNIEEINKVLSFTKNARDIHQEVNYLLRYVAEILGTWVGNLADNRDRSYLILTRESKKSRDEYVEKSKRKVIWFFVSIAISIITGIVSSFIFEWLAKF
jgi:hypothetical protein